jgi:hypothetical protein
VRGVRCTKIDRRPCARSDGMLDTICDGAPRPARNHGMVSLVKELVSTSWLRDHAIRGVAHVMVGAYDDTRGCDAHGGRRSAGPRLGGGRGAAGGWPGPVGDTKPNDLRWL